MNQNHDNLPPLPTANSVCGHGNDELCFDEDQVREIQREAFEVGRLAALAAQPADLVLTDTERDAIRKGALGYVRPEWFGGSIQAASDALAAQPAQVSVGHVIVPAVPTADMRAAGYKALEDSPWPPNMSLDLVYAAWVAAAQPSREAVDDIRELLGHISDVLPDEAFELIDTKAWNNVSRIVGTAEALAPEAAEGLRDALEYADDMLTNLQPHIEQACLPGHAVFIDNYVDPVLERIRAALVATAHPAADAEVTKQDWREEVQRLSMMAGTAMHQTPRDQRNILEDIAERLSRLTDLAAHPVAGAMQRLAHGEAGEVPSGYAYRYPDGIRFNGGNEVNGCRPSEVIPYYFAAPRAQVKVGRKTSNPYKGGTQAYLATEYYNEGWNDCLAASAHPVGPAEPVTLTAKDVAEARELLAKCSASAILSGDHDEAMRAFHDRALVYRFVCEANNLLIGTLAAHPVAGGVNAVADMLHEAAGDMPWPRALEIATKMAATEPAQAKAEASK